MYENLGKMREARFALDPPRRFLNDSSPLKTKQKKAEADIHPKEDTAYK